jgi:hypothetical protein
MTAFPVALELAGERLDTRGDMSLGECFAELGVAPFEAEELIRNTVKRADTVGEAVGMALYLGLLIGKEMAG